MTPLFRWEYIFEVHKDLELSSAEPKKSLLHKTKVASRAVSS